MTIGLSRYRKAATSAGLVVLTAVWIGWTSNREAAANEDLDEFLAYGVASISPGETARFHVVTVGIPRPHPAELVIYDRLGNRLARSRGYLLPGKAVSLDLKFDAQTGTAVGQNRLEFYAKVRFAKLRTGYVIPSLEVVEDATGRTMRMVIDPIG